MCEIGNYPSDLLFEWLIEALVESVTESDSL